METLELKRLPKLPFDIEEAVNQLRVNLSFSGENKKVIFITSTVPNEGKSFVALSLWRSLASVDRRVLLIDGDLRLSNFRNEYGLAVTNRTVSVAHVLSGQAKLADAIYSTNVPNGYIIPVTKLISNPSPLLSSRKFHEMIVQCRSAFDYVIIDTPPLGSVADALNISKECDGGVLVVRSNGISRRAIKTSVDSLQRAGSPLLGIVLNRVDTSSSSNYYYSKYGYGYGYDYYYYSSEGKKKHRKHRKK